jgi:DNA mismatch endonuclease, patch repair protein
MHNTTRSEIMRAVKSKDTTPEMIERRLIHRMGYRYRIHLGDLPGKPDIVFPGRRKIIFVNGCFWHGHSCHRGARQPKTNSDYWRTKIDNNIKRDSLHLQALQTAGWHVLTVWECDSSTKSRNALTEMLTDFLG